MRNLSVAAMIAAAAVPASSAQNVKDEFCESLSQAAESIMKRRQEGVSMVTQMKLTEKMQPEVRDLTRSLITEAYSKPRYSTPSNQQRASEDFRDEFAVACYKK